MFRHLDVGENTVADLSALERWLTNLSDPNADPWPDFKPENLEPVSNGASAIDPTQDFGQVTEEESCSEEEESCSEEEDSNDKTGSVK